MNTRRVQPELLDELPPEQKEARESRRDLQRVNWLMGNAGIIRKAWKEAAAGRWCRRIVDMGGGDGTLLLRFLQALPEGTRPGRAVLVDREPVVAEETRAALVRLGSEVSIVAADIFEWLEQEPAVSNTFLMTNLFLHHFEDEPLQRLLKLASRQCEVFAACEPRRSGLSLLGSRLLGVIGCNAVTRHDAVVSVRAGFCGKELSRLWPKGEEWLLQEEETGLFSHFFCARKQE